MVAPSGDDHCIHPDIRSFLDGACGLDIRVGHPRCEAMNALYLALAPAVGVSTYDSLVREQYLSQQTMHLIRQYENREWLVPSIDMISACTWNALLRNEECGPVLHNDGSVSLFPQPDDFTCWASCLATMLELSLEATRAAVPITALSGGALNNNSESHELLCIPKIDNSKHDLVTFYPQSWTTEAFARLARSGPIMLNALLEPELYSEGFGSSGHCVLIIGVRGCAQPDGTRLIIRLWDPSPVGLGSASSITYYDLMNSQPLSTFRITVRKTSYLELEQQGGGPAKNVPAETYAENPSLDLTGDEVKPFYDSATPPTNGSCGELPSATSASTQWLTISTPYLSFIPPPPSSSNASYTASVPNQSRKTHNSFQGLEDQAHRPSARVTPRTSLQVVGDAESLGHSQPPTLVRDTKAASLILPSTARRSSTLASSYGNTLRQTHSTRLVVNGRESDAGPASLGPLSDESREMGILPPDYQPEQDGTKHEWIKGSDRRGGIRDCRVEKSDRREQPTGSRKRGAGGR